MHRPTFALAAAGGLAGQFGPQQLGRQTLGEHVVHAAVDRDEIVLVIQQYADRGRDAFLAARGVVGHLHAAGLHRANDAIIAVLDDRLSTRLNSSHSCAALLPSSVWKKKTGSVKENAPGRVVKERAK